MSVNQEKSIRVSAKTHEALHILKHEMRYSSIEKVLNRLIVLGIKEIKRVDDLLMELQMLQCHGE